MIFVRDVDGAIAFVFLRLDGNCFFGGSTSDHYRYLVPKTSYGAHMHKTLSGMLDFIAELANLPSEPPSYLGYFFELYGNDWCVPIKRQINGTSLAYALGCTVPQIVDHFEALVKIV